jgi:hypothetical protein
MIKKRNLMRNIFIIIAMVAAFLYMFVILGEKYETMKEANAKIEQHK